MTTYSIDGPDGKTYSIEGPEGATRDQVIAAVQEKIGGPQYEKPSPLVSVGHGISKISTGLQQLYLMAKDAATGGNEAPAFTEQTKADEALYERGRGPNAGIDWWSHAGTALPGVLALPLLPEAALATTGARVATMAGLGGAQGAAEFNPTGTWAGKGLQTAVGAGTGAAAQGVLDKVVLPVVSKVASLASQGVNALRNTIAGPDPVAVRAAVTQQLAQQGIDIASLPAARQASLIDEALKVASAGKVIDPVAASRAADFAALKMPEGTVGQITQSPAAFAAEQNAQGLERIGAPLQQRFVEQNQRLQQVIPEMQLPSRTAGATATTPYQAAESARVGVQSWWSQSQKVVSDLYNTAKNALGANTEVPLQPVADTLGKVADEYGIEHVAGAVTSRLQQYGLLGGKQTKSLTVAEAEKLRTFIGNNIDPSNRPQMAALKILQRSIDEAVGNVPAAAAPGAAQEAFQAAREAAKIRFTTGAATPVERLIEAGGEAAPTYLKNTILGGKPGEIATLGSVLKQHAPQAWENIRVQVLQHLHDAAMVRGNEFGGARFNKALNDIGIDRLRVLFSPEEISQLATIGRVSKAVTVAPAKSAVNYSGTAAALSNLMNSQRAPPGILSGLVGMIPFAGKPAVGAWQFGKQALQQGALQRAVNQAASPGAAAYSAPPLDPASVKRFLALLLSGGVQAGASSAADIAGRGP